MIVVNFSVARIGKENLMLPPKSGLPTAVLNDVRYARRIFANDDQSDAPQSRMIPTKQ